MPTILELIEAKNQLAHKASKNYKRIEVWYMHEGDYVVHYPMNVLANTIGKSSKTGHHNAYVLARLYADFLDFKLDNFDRLKNKLMDYHKGDYIIDTFSQDLNDFCQQVNTFKTLIDRYDTDATITGVDLHPLLLKFANHLMENQAFDKEMMANACAAAIGSLNKIIQPELSMDEVIQIYDSFYMYMSVSSFSYHLTSNTMLPHLNDKKTREKDLTDFLIKMLPYDVVIQSFERFFTQEFNLINMISDKFSKLKRPHEELPETPNVKKTKRSDSPPLTNNPAIHFQPLAIHYRKRKREELNKEEYPLRKFQNNNN